MGGNREIRKTRERGEELEVKFWLWMFPYDRLRLRLRFVRLGFWVLLEGVDGGCLLILIAGDRELFPGAFEIC